MDLITSKRGDLEVTVEGRQLKLTNLGKIFWPELKITKGELLNFYLKIAPYILPYLKDRPESLLRYPNGIRGQAFYQKNIDGLAPGWAEILPVSSEENKKTINYFLCQNLASLLYLINLGCIDLNPWNSRKNSLNRPDYLIIDLDPEAIDFQAVIETALAVKSVLDELGLIGYPKTSGATGIHIYLPLQAKYDYKTVREFARLLVTVIHQKFPKITSIERSPSKRQGRVYLDYLQNARGQTLAAPYSLRARQNAAVSTPLSWLELQNSQFLPDNFNYYNIFDRLDKVGDIFAPVLTKVNPLPTNFL